MLIVFSLWDLSISDEIFLIFYCRSFTRFIDFPEFAFFFHYVASPNSSFCRLCGFPLLCLLISEVKFVGAFVDENSTCVSYFGPTYFYCFAVLIGN